jgi:hypothetical protein
MFFRRDLGKRRKIFAFGDLATNGVHFIVESFT